MKILYICDRARCMVCNPDCRHTSELAHAAHFDAQPYADTLAELFCYWEGALWERDGTEKHCVQCGLPCIHEKPAGQSI